MSNKVYYKRYDKMLKLYLLCVKRGGRETVILQSQQEALVDRLVQWNNGVLSLVSNTRRK